MHGYLADLLVLIFAQNQSRDREGARHRCSPFNGRRANNTCDALPDGRGSVMVITFRILDACQ